MSTSQPTPTGAFHVYDTTLRDGAQQEGLNLSVADKLGDRPPARRARRRLHRGRLAGRQPQGHRVLPAGRASELRPARPRRWPRSAPPAGPAPRPPTTRWWPRSATAAPSVVTLVAKSHDRHVELALRTTLEENLAMVRDTVSHLRAEGQRVFLDAEHFFDGYRDNRDYALEVLRTAFDAGAEVVALCDTNGGMLPGWVGDVVDDVLATDRRPGRHPLPQRHRLRGRQHAGGGRRRRHPRAGHPERLRRAHRQRRPGLAWSPTSSSSSGRQVLPEGRLRDATRIAHAVAEVTNFPPASRQPYVGRQRVRAQGRAARQRDQGRPEPLPAHGAGACVGNDMRLLVSDMAGRASIELKGARARLRPRRAARPRS